MSKISLKAARVNAGLTQKEAAKKLNVSQKTLCSWEKSITFPRTKHIDPICDLYRVTYEQVEF